MRALGNLAAALAAVLALPAAAQAPAQGPTQAGPLFALKQLAPGVYAVIGAPAAGSNAGFVIGDDGVLAIDTLGTPEAGQALVEAIRKTTSKPIRYVIDTHYHIDHVSGNAAFKAAGAQIIAHKNVPGWIHAENLHLFGASITPERRTQIEQLAAPDRTIDRPLTLTLGRRKVEVRPIQGHTGGDLMVEVPDAKVAFTGDILWNHRTPTTIDGLIVKWTQSLADLEKSSDTVFVPGHGDVASKKDVEDLRVFFTDLRRLTAEGRAAGLSGDALIAAEGPRLKALHGDWPYMDRAPPILIAQMEQELAGTKRVPVPAK